MSLINQMLKDLDARGRDGQPVPHMPPEVRVTGASRPLLARVPAAWWAVLLLALLLLGLVLWVVSHRGSARNLMAALPEAAEPAPPSRRPQDQLAVSVPPAASRATESASQPDPVPGSVSEPLPGPAVPEPASTPARAASPALPVPDPPSAPGTALPEPAPGAHWNQKLSLKLIPTLDLLAKGQRGEPSRASPARPDAVADRAVPERTASDRTASDRTASDRTASDRTASDRTAADRTASDRTAADRTVSDRAAPAQPAAERTRPAPRGPDESSKWGKLSVPLSSAQRAEREYRQGLQAWQAGRQGEALAALEQALQLDALHSSARQTLVAWQLELGQRAAAIRQLQEGLGHDPAQASLAMMLARLQVDQGDIGAALKTLQHSLPYTVNRADYHAFLAALWQREQKHAAAIEHYRIALGLMPDNGVWWMGLGISLQASGQRQSAREAFLRAAASAALGPELKAFVSERLAQLP